MSVRHPAFRTAEASERTAAATERIADALEELLRLAKGEVPPLVLESLLASPHSPFRGYLLNREGVVSDNEGSFARSAGKIDLNRIGVGQNVAHRIFRAVTGSETADILSVEDLIAFHLSGRTYTAQQFGKTSRKLLADWHIQLEELLG